MKDVIFDEFQNYVGESLLRHKSLIDTLSKFGQSASKVNRAVSKTITDCGCIELHASKQTLPTSIDSLKHEDIKICLKTHVDGDICESCRDYLERELGEHLFYITALCNTLDINLYDVLIREYDKMKTLGKFSMR